ncbi:MAG: von Willebrand factor type A domain-containing protein [Planctomycetota bacterium]
MSNTRDWSDDPRLTAYALGELEEEERTALEAELADDPRGAELLDGIRATAGRLTEGLASEPLPALSPDDRGAIVARARVARGGPGARRWRRLAVGLGAAAAAGVAATIGVSYLTRGAVGSMPAPATRNTRDLARLEAPGAAPSAAPTVTTSEAAPGASRPAPAAPTAPAQVGRKVGRMQERTAQLYYRGPSDSVPPSDLSELRDQFGVPGLELKVQFELLDRAGERYAEIVENPFVRVVDDPRSTFSIDVDTGSYANVRRFLNDGQLPPADAVRIEELVNYFSYDYPVPAAGEPFSVSAEVASCPWTPEHRLVRLGLRGKPLPLYGQKERNLVFLIDVSGSMNDERKLPLLKRGMRLLVDSLGESDRVALVVYAGAAGLVLDSTPCDRKDVILAAIEELSAGGSTNGGQGIELAYAVARHHFAEGGINRVVLATDGDFNVGVTGDEALTELIEEKAKSGVSLSVLGFGTGNLKDSKMEQLADHGDGNYAYIDSVHEARKVLVREMGGTLETIAKDVKVQVLFNPDRVAAFRLIGYENRMLEHQDFDDDTKDAGEIGAGHRVTALYEVVPSGVEPPAEPGAAAARGISAEEDQRLRALGYADESTLRALDDLGYADEQSPPQLQDMGYVEEAPEAPTADGAGGLPDVAWGEELLLLRLRYKAPEGGASRLQEATLSDPGQGWSTASEDFRFAAAVAGFGMVLRGSRRDGDLDLRRVHELALAGAGPDPWGYRREFLLLVERALAIHER